jgi:RNA polymerase sigma-70 factor (ECF subfamily)
LVQDDARVRVAVERYFAAVWRVLRRNGVSEAEVDDAAQKVFLVFTRKLAEIAAHSEHAFLLSTAIFVANDVRRSQRRRLAHETQTAPPTLQPDHLLERTQALAQLDAILDTLAPELRAVFVLHELEEMTMAHIAEALAVPAGTVASRLRRAREQFEELCARAREGVAS